MACCGRSRHCIVEAAITRQPSCFRGSGDVHLHELDEVADAPASEEQERDFVRIFRAAAPSVFVLNRDRFEQLSAVAARGSMSSADGDFSRSTKRASVGSEMSFTEQDIDDEIEQFLGQLRDRDPEDVLRPFTDEELRRFVVKHISVEQSFQFCLREGLAPLYLQPKYLVLLSESEGIVIVTYGFVAEATKSQTQVVGDRPDRKRTPWIARLELRTTISGGSDRKKINSRVLSHTIFPARVVLDTRTFIDADVPILREKYFPSTTSQ
ncbi:unnamed protein product [Amoebophrya sp. A25]|nr:unnamed protein product [Amoebophrya sp. A25]|eukprot:GSA25T00015884001.1